MKRLVFLFAALLLTGCIFENDPRPGYFDPLGPVIWKGDINLNTTYYVAEGDSLIIEKGSTVTLQGTAGLLVDGSLKIMGESDDPVTFVNNGNILLTAYSSGNEILWCNMTGCTLTLATGAAIQYSRIKYLDLVGSANPIITGCRIGYLVCNNNAEPIVSGSQFDRNGFFSDLSCKVIETFDLSKPQINGCNILGNSALGSAMTNYTFLSYSSAQYDFRNNWWTTSDSAYLTNRIFFRSVGSVLWHTPIAISLQSLSLP